MAAPSVSAPVTVTEPLNFARSPPVLPVMTGAPLRLTVPAVIITPPPFGALLPLMLPPFIVNARPLYTPPPKTALLPVMLPPFIVNTPLLKTAPPNLSLPWAVPVPPVM